jgi:hypothetical protein
MEHYNSNSSASTLSKMQSNSSMPKVTLADVFKNVRVKSSKPTVTAAVTGTTVGECKKPDTVVPKGSTFKMSTKTANAQRTGNTSGKTVQRNEKEDIEIYHDKKIRYFESLQTLLPQKRMELEVCVDPLERVAIEKEIQAIENREEETSYFLQVYDILAEYKDATTVQKESKKSVIENTDNTIGVTKLSSLEDFIFKRDTTFQQILSDEFYRSVDPKKLCTSSLWVGSSLCEDCSGNLEISNGTYACSDCGTLSNHAVSDFKWSYKDIQDIQYKSSFAYKRLTRFCDLLNSWQAKEHTDIPESVVDAVRSEIQKDGPRAMGSLEYKKVRYYLKRTNNCKYYEHWAYIVARIKGEPPLKITPDIEDELIRMFKAIQEPFEEARREVQPDRTSFLSYTYVCYKFFELLGMYDKLKFFNLLKSREKLDVQDKIWKAMCEKLGWPFYRSKT